MSYIAIYGLGFEDDPDASLYCPRCHGMFLKGRETCGDCGEMPLRPF